MATLTRKKKLTAFVAAQLTRAESLFAVSPGLSDDVAKRVRLTAGMLFVLVVLLASYFAGLLMTEDWFKRATVVTDAATFVTSITLGTGIYLVARGRRGAWAPYLLVTAAHAMILGFGLLTSGKSDSIAISDNYLVVIVLMGSLVLSTRGNAINVASAFCVELICQQLTAAPTPQRVDEFFFLLISCGLIFCAQYIRSSSQEKADRDLRRSQRFMSSLLDHLPLAMTCRDADEGFRYVFANRMAARIYGVPAPTMLGKPDTSFQSAAQLQITRASDLKRLAAGSGEASVEAALEQGHEDEIVTALGIRTLHVTKAVVPDDDGRPRYLIDLAEDLTERVEERRELDLYLRVAREMSVGLLVFQPEDPAYPDETLVLRVANQASANFLGMRPADAVTQKVDVLAFDTRLRAACAKLARVSVGTIDIGTLTRFEPRTEAPTYFFLRAFGVEGHAVGVLCENISDRVRAEATLEADRAKNVESSRLASLGEMAGGIAHEINNPLTVIQGKARMASWLLARGAEANGHATISTQERNSIIDFMEGIERNVARIAKIIRGLRAITRDGSADPLRTESVLTIVDDALSLCRVRIVSDGIAIKSAAVAPDLLVGCRATQIVQILVNLLANAHDAVVDRIKAGSKEPPWISLDVQTTPSHIAFVVANCGTPIPLEVRNKMFQPFFTTKEVGRGTGLGLSISLTLARGHEGTLRYDEDSPFPRFVLTLQRIQDPAEGLDEGADDFAA